MIENTNFKYELFVVVLLLLFFFWGGGGGITSLLYVQKRLIYNMAPLYTN